MTTNESLNQHLETYVAEREGWLQEAVEITTGDANANIEQIFPRPSAEKDQARRDTDHLDLSPDNEARLREVASRFGLGGEADLTLAEQGMQPGHVNVFEGGLVWKIKAEAELAGDAGTYIFAGSPYRNTSAAEHAFGTTGDTEYDTAKKVAQSLEDFVPLQEEVVLPFGYDINNNYAVSNQETGQFVQIGTKDGKPVIVLRVDREELPDGKYQKQPDTAAIMGIVADVLTMCGDSETPVGVTTSSTYASRSIDAVRAGLARNRHFGVAMYGRQTIANVKGESVAAPTELFQFPGELRVMYDKLQALKADYKQVR